MNIVVVGAGGHAAVVVECLQAIGGYDVIGLVDTDPDAEPVIGIPVIGSDEMLPGLLASGGAAAAVAVGSNVLRQRVGLHLLDLGYRLPVISHPLALVSPSARLGDGTVVMAGAIVQARSRIGRFVIVNTGARIDHDASIGEAAHVAPGACLAGCVEVGDRAILGVNCAVRPHASIGSDAVVGAGSAVVSGVGPGVRVGGVPARPLSANG